MVFEDFHTKKRLGQNFIFDTVFLDSIVDKIGLEKTDVVVEVGAGFGTLTTCLAKRAARIISYEIDNELEPILKENLGGFDNIELYFKDAMKVTDFPPEYKLVANIPYYITSPIILKFLADRRCREICVLVQDNVARRITANPGGKDYGAFPVTCQAHADCKIIKNVGRNMFRPSPNVDSAFVILEKHNRYNIPTGFDDFIKAVFSKRRKKISNSININVLERCGIDPSVRPENLTVEQFVKLCQNLS